MRSKTIKVIEALLQKGPVATIEIVKRLGGWDQYYKWEGDYLEPRLYESKWDHLYRIRNLMSAQAIYCSAYSFYGDDLLNRIGAERKSILSGLVLEAIQNASIQEAIARPDDFTDIDSMISRCKN